MPDRVRVLVVVSRIIAPVLRFHAGGSKSFVANGENALAVGVIAEDGFATVTTIQDLVDRAGILRCAMREALRVSIVRQNLCQYCGPLLLDFR